jgi:DNA polymerase V
MERFYRSGEVIKRPLAGFRVHAAFESPGTDYEEDRISLDEYVSLHPEAVFYIKVEGDCMDGSGIKEGDLLVVDRSLVPMNGDVIIGVLDGMHIIAAYIEFEGKKYLVPDNRNYEPIPVNECTSFTLEGVIPHTILDQRRQRNVRADRLQQFLCERRAGVPARAKRQGRRSA